MWWGEGRKRSRRETFGALALLTTTVLALATAAPSTAAAAPPKAAPAIAAVVDHGVPTAALSAIVIPLSPPAAVGQPAALDVRPFDASEGVDEVAETQPETTVVEPEPVEPVTEPAPEPEPVPATPEPAPAAEPAPPTPEPPPATVEPPAAATPTPAEASEPASPVMPTPWSVQMGASNAELVFHADGTVAFGGVTRLLSEISQIHVTGTAGDDTFTIDFGGVDRAVAIGFDGGAGVDTLITRGAPTGFGSRPTSGSSGTLTIGQATVSYTGVEPFSNVGGGDVRFMLGAGDDRAVLRDVGGRLQLSSTNSSFATTNFDAPGLLDQILRLEGGDGYDSLVVLGIINLMHAAFEALFESITFADAEVTAGSVSMTAVAEVTEGLPLSVPDCGDFDDFVVATCIRHQAVAHVIIDGGSITAGDIELRAEAIVRPPGGTTPENVVLADADAVVDVRGGARIDARGDLVIIANAVVGPLDLNGQSAAAAVVRSNASATVTDALVSVRGSASINANSAVALSASSIAPAVGSGITIALLSVTASAAAQITGDARMTVGSSLAITAANDAALSAVADASQAGGAGVATVHLEQSTDAAIDSTSPLGVTAASVDLLATQRATVTASAFSNGASIDADATAQADVTATTTARIVGANVTTPGTVTVGATAADTLAVAADSGGSESSATALLTADLDTRAYALDATIAAGGGAAFTALSAAQTSAWARGGGGTTVVEAIADTAVADAGDALASAAAAAGGRDLVDSAATPAVTGATAVSSATPDPSASAPAPKPDDSPYPSTTPLPEVALVGVGTAGIAAGPRGHDQSPADAAANALGSAVRRILAGFTHAMYAIYAGISALSEPTRGPPPGAVTIPEVVPPAVPAVLLANISSGSGIAPHSASSIAVPTICTVQFWTGAAADACAGGFSLAREACRDDIACASIHAITVRVSAGDGALGPASGAYAADAVETAICGAGIQGPESCGVRLPLTAAAGLGSSGGLHQTAIDIAATGGGGGWAGGSGATTHPPRAAGDALTWGSAGDGEMGKRLGWWTWGPPAQPR